MKNENTQKQARRFKIVVTDLLEDKTLMNVTTGAVIVTAASPFDNLTNENKKGRTLSSQYFDCDVDATLNCMQSTIEGIAKTLEKRKELKFLFKLWAMMKLSDNKEENEDE